MLVAPEWAVGPETVISARGIVTAGLGEIRLDLEKSRDGPVCGWKDAYPVRTLDGDDEASVLTAVSIERAAMKILLHGLNYAPEELGIGKYSGEMMQFLAANGHRCVVVTTPPYYPQWEIPAGYHGRRYSRERHPVEARDKDTAANNAAAAWIHIVRCPLWVPSRVSAFKRIIHLASFGLSSFPAVIWKAIRFRPDAIITVEPAAVCMPTAWIAARMVGAKAWLHVQDFEVDMAFELGIVRAPMLRKLVLFLESLLMRRFDCVSSISPNMIDKLQMERVDAARIRYFPNWVDCNKLRPLVHTEDEQERLREQFGLPPDKCIALYAGNIGVKQGLEIIVEAARHLRRDQASKVHFVICGQGAAHSQLCEMAQGIDNIQMLPVQPFEKFNELMNCADLHLLPQRADAADLVMPSKLTGMLATGRAVVACAAPGTQIADVVENRGLVVSPGSVLEFAEAVKQLSENPKLCRQMGVAARQYALKNLSRQAILQRFEAELYELCAQESKAHSKQHQPALSAVNPSPSVGVNSPQFEKRPQGIRQTDSAEVTELGVVT